MLKRLQSGKEDTQATQRLAEAVNFFRQGRDPHRSV